jgi:uncharacterized membrane protein YdjX (TVP38/TMEM64 family)
VNKTLLRALALLLLAGVIALAFTYRDHIDVAALQAWVDGAGVAAPLLFVA